MYPWDDYYEKNWRWKGDDVGYASLHIWVKRRKQKPVVCEMCNYFPPEDLSNISGEYRRDVDDFQWLCTKCHLNFDRQIRNTIKIKQIKMKQILLV